MRFVFHADASQEIGAGHVMRSSVLAEEAIARGYDCIFIGNIKNIKWVSERINSMKFLEIHSSFDSFKSVPTTDILVIDSYILPTDCESIKVSNWLYLVSIADAITPNFKVNMVVKPGLIRSNPKKERTNFLSGPDYVLIRKSISKRDYSEVNQISPVIIISLGGANQLQLASLIANELDNLTLDLQAHFFINGNIRSKTGKKYFSHNFGSNFDQIASISDLAITSSGTSSLEFLAREIPMGIICIVENQKEYYEQLGSLGLAVQLGNFSKSSIMELEKNYLQKLVADSDFRQNLRTRIKNIVDLKGADRILSAIENEIQKMIL